MIKTQVSMKNNPSNTIHYIVTDEKAYVLFNWKEIEGWYKLPFYKKWFIKKPIKELIHLKGYKKYI
jgi:hypothetical protein